MAAFGSTPRPGLISLFVHHPNAANLTMALMLIFGIYAITKLNTQFFPTVETKTITVSIAWPGASAEDASTNILSAVEPEVRFLDGVDEVVSYAREGSATIRLDFEPNADMQKAQSDVEAAIALITTLPEEAEVPEISRPQFFDSVGKFAISGPFSEAALKVFAKRMRDDLINRGVDRVTFNGMRDEEILVSVPDHELRRLALTVGDVADRIRDNSRDLPSGNLDGAIERQLRTETEAETPEAIGTIEVKSLTGGERVLLRDVADIRADFDDDEARVYQAGQRAIELTVWRAANADTLEVAAIVTDYLAEARPTLPPTLQIVEYEIRAEAVLERILLLIKNGLTGLILVVGVMYLFLSARIAFWVAAGIPVAMFATLGVMYATGQSINMISLFALIMTLGIIVDDAIVVGEHTATRSEAGDGPFEAAERGAGRMIAPVVAASLTTMAAFAPILLVRDVIGQIMSALPLVAIAVLIASLVECFLVLPGHLAHSLNAKTGRRRWSYWRQFLIAAVLTGLCFAALHMIALSVEVVRNLISVQEAEIGVLWSEGVLGIASSVPALVSWLGLHALLLGAVFRENFQAVPANAVMIGVPLVAYLVATIIEAYFWFRTRGAPEPGNASGGFRRWFDNGFAWFRDRPFRALVALVYQNRYIYVALCVATLMVALQGMVGGGRVGFSFFPAPEAENIRATVEFNAGLPEQQAVAALAEIEAAVRTAEATLVGSGKRLLVTAISTLGKAGSSRGDNLAQIDVELTASEKREIRTPEIVRAWRNQVPKIAGVKRVAIFERRGGPPGRDIDIRLQDGDPAVLKRAALDVADLLTGFPGVSGVSDDLPYGKPEIVMTLTPRGAALGFTVEDVGRQVRNSFEGAIARRLARGDEEVTIRVEKQLPEIGANQLRSLELRSPAGEFVPLVEIVDLAERQGFSVIQRRDGRVTVAVTADVDLKVATNQEIVADLQTSGALDAITGRYGIDYRFSGREEERRTSFEDLRFGAVIAVTVIYIILAWVFASYSRPIAVILIIPFGIVGAIFGHYVMDFKLTILSYLGLLGLAGILVNDSIILVSRIDDRLREGEGAAAAAIGASCDRLRAVLLTSLTTVGGLLPLLFERSLQAQFLLPMAITMVFGLGFATLIVLFLVPCLVGIGTDIGRLFRFVYGPRRSVPDPAE
ncbi:MAG: efflux RND transporter permease subunit [Pseudomonadota bacterium]